MDIYVLGFFLPNDEFQIDKKKPGCIHPPLETQGDLTDTNKKLRSRVFIAWKCYRIPIKQWYRILFIPYGLSSGLTGAPGRPGSKGKSFNIGYKNAFVLLIRTGQYYHGMLEQ